MANTGVAEFRRVAVVGAGMVGLATAWFLQERGVEVTIFDRTGVAAGSSWGNAGWLTPGIATPLPEPAVLAYGIKAVLNPASPVYVPPSLRPRLLRFLVGFLRHSTTTAWERAMAALIPLNSQALASFDILTAAGVAAPTYEVKSFLAAYRHVAERETLLEEITKIKAAGQDLSFAALTGAQAQEIEPLLSDEISAALVLHEQRFLNPGEFVHALADSVVARGGTIHQGWQVTGIDDQGPGRVWLDREAPAIEGRTRDPWDAVVIATGAWLNHLADRAGVRALVQAGRGYSFTVDLAHEPQGPIYFPAARVACTPLGDQQLRVAGMMEFRQPEAALDPRRIAAIADAARPLLRGVDLAARRDEWVGSRPCTIDGLPLIGRTRSARIAVAGGHGMWGMTLGPITGRLLADSLVTGVEPPELRPFDPLR